MPQCEIDVYILDIDAKNLVKAQKVKIINFLVFTSFAAARITHCQCLSKMYIHLIARAVINALHSSALSFCALYLHYGLSQCVDIHE